MGGGVDACTNGGGRGRVYEWGGRERARVVIREFLDIRHEMCNTYHSMYGKYNGVNVHVSLDVKSQK